MQNELGFSFMCVKGHLDVFSLGLGSIGRTCGPITGGVNKVIQLQSMQ
jgi:hypothetical protein